MTVSASPMLTLLSLESNCKDHQVYLNMRANPPATEDLNYELSGHAMMLTNPLPSHLAMGPEKCHHEPPDMPTLSLVKLMETAQRLPLEGGEIPPILALRVIREDERYGLITEKDFRKITNKLRESSRCYGYVLSYTRENGIVLWLTNALLDSVLC